MYAKIFNQIYDSSLAEDYQVRHIFMDMLVLANCDGVVDMTHEAISRRINVPLDVLKPAILKLESPDERSRSEEAHGARLQRLDDHRDWGWLIVNYAHYRALARETDRREKTRTRVKKLRERNGGVTPCNAVKRSVTQRNADGASCNAPVTPCNAVVNRVTQRNATLHMQKQKQRQKQSTPLTPQGGNGLSALGLEVSTWFHRKPDSRWTDKELKALKEVEKSIEDEDVELLAEYYKAASIGDRDIRRRDVVTLLNNWPGELDRARAWKENPTKPPEQPKINPVQRKRAIEELMANHPANKASLKHDGKCTDAQKADYLKLKSDLETVNREVAMLSYTT